MGEARDGADWTELSGRLEGRSHRLGIRVYYEDTDFSGLVYHTSYLRWCERGRTDYLRLLGISHTRLLTGEDTGEPAAFAVRRMSLEFLKPARIDDILEVVTAPAGVTKASVTLTQEVRRSGLALFRLEAQCVLVSLDGRLLRLPSPFLAALGDQVPQ
jgi:acyl-CoA thioester hydrolase